MSTPSSETRHSERPAAPAIDDAEQTRKDSEYRREPFAVTARRPKVARFDDFFD